MQVLQVIMAGKGQKNLEIYQRKQYLRHNWIAIKPHFMFTRKNIKIFPAKCFGYDICFSNEYFCLSLCCTSTFFYGYDFPCFFQNSNLNCLHAILFLK